MNDPVYASLHAACSRPAPFSRITTDTLWTDEHISAQMLRLHLDPDEHKASRPRAFVERSLEWISRRFELGPGQRVIDFGCGPGLYTTGFARCGATVAGIDFSRRSLEHARGVATEESLEIEYIEADYRQFRPPGKADLVTLIYQDYCALAPDDRHNLLVGFRELIADRGHLLLDAAALTAFEARHEMVLFGERFMDGFWSAGPYFGLQCSLRYEPEHVSLDHFTIFEPERRWEVYNWMQYFEPDSLQRELEAAGLRVLEVFANVCGDPYDDAAADLAMIAVAD